MAAAKRLVCVPTDATLKRKTIAWLLQNEKNVKGLPVLVEFEDGTSELKSTFNNQERIFYLELHKHALLSRAKVR